MPALPDGAYLDVNPQGLMPALALGERVIAQSMAILDYLEETYPEPSLLPDDPIERAEARAFAQLIASDIHPLNNFRVHRFLEERLGISQEQRRVWYRHWIKTGFDSLEETLRRRPRQGDFCFGDRPTIADLSLVPQVANARRFDCDLGPYPLIRAIDETCRAPPAFQAATGAQQPDYPG